MIHFVVWMTFFIVSLTPKATLEQASIDSDRVYLWCLTFAAIGILGRLIDLHNDFKSYVTFLKEKDKKTQL